MIPPITTAKAEKYSALVLTGARIFFWLVLSYAALAGIFALRGLTDNLSKSAKASADALAGVQADVHALQAPADQALDKVTAIETDVGRLVQLSGGAVNTFRQIEVAERGAAQKQIETAAETEEQIKGLVAHADTVVTDLDKTVNATTTAIVNGQADTHEVLTAAAADLTAPEFKQTLTNVAAASTNVAVAAKEGAGTLVEVHGAASDLHGATTYELKQLEAPVTKLHVIYVILLTAVRKLFL